MDSNKSILNLSENVKGEFKVENKDFNKTEVIVLTKNTWVKQVGEDETKLRAKGTEVKVSGNDKIQLLGSRAGYRKEDKLAQEKFEKEEAKKEEAEAKHGKGK